MRVCSSARLGPLFALVAFVLFVGACSSQKEVVSLAAIGRRASSVEIDEDPWALIPSGAVAWVQLKLPALLDVEFGPELIELLGERIPLAQGSGVSLADDVDSLSGAGYATVSLDWLVVARGRFDQEKVQTAFAAHGKTKAGARIIGRDYAGEKLFVVGKVALCVLSSQTLVIGSETALRRVIEKVQEGRLNKSIPPWLMDLLEEPAEPLTLGLDLDSNPIPAVLKMESKFLEGLRAGRMVGNFSRPGLNLTGSLNYSKPAKAKEAAGFIKVQETQLRRYSLLLRMMGLPQPVQHLQAEATDRNLQVALELKEGALTALLKRFKREINAYLDQNLESDSSGKFSER